jgi:Trypsin
VSLSFARIHETLSTRNLHFQIAEKRREISLHRVRLSARKVAAIASRPYMVSMKSRFARQMSVIYRGLSRAPFYSTVIGWGKRRHIDENGTNVLHEAEVPIISNESCRSVYYDYVITKNMFCAGANRVDTCAGDSGGPILCR